MKRYGRLKALVLSFYCRDLYLDVARHWRGIGLLYLWNLLALSWMAVMFAQHGQTGGINQVIDQVPRISITGGVASIADSPHVIRDVRRAAARRPRHACRR